jgi:hypothetical protein
MPTHPLSHLASLATNTCVIQALTTSCFDFDAQDPLYPVANELRLGFLRWARR